MRTKINIYRCVTTLGVIDYKFTVRRLRQVKEPVIAEFFIELGHKCRQFNTSVLAVF